ncbi:MAG: hypothetical protein WCD18_25780 [Thermosynechococcaceae cyanobacterium]
MLTVVNRRSPQNRVRSAKGGFTLTELMIASLMTLGVMTIGGVAFSAMISASQKNDSEGENRVEINRALAFASAETQEASTINTQSAPSEFSPSSSEVVTSSVQSVLRLSISTLTRPVVYYLATPASSNLKWRGPRVLYRWGPSYTTSGAYGTDKDTPSSWTHQALVDGLESTASTPSCATGWTASPSSGSTGFYACINATNKVAQLFNKGRVTQVLGKTTPYLLSSQAFARSSATSPIFTVSGGNFTINQTSTITVNVLGSDIRCSSGASPAKTAAIVNVVRSGSTTASSPYIIDPAGTMPTITYTGEAAGTSVNFTGYVPTTSNPNNSCGLDGPAGSTGFNSVANASQVRILKHGDTVPTVGGWGGGASVSSFISSYVDSTRTKVSLPYPDRQSIILYELYATSTSSSSFDLQDMVLLVTANPS